SLFPVDSLLSLPQILFVQPEAQPQEEMIVNGSDLSLNGIFYAHTRFPDISGKGLGVSVKENRPDTADIDFRLRYKKTGLESNNLSTHATIMATLIAGAGNSYFNAQGAAYRANISSVSFQALMPEPDSVYRKFRQTVQNHSYGTGIENFYGADAWAYDQSVISNDTLLHVFSAGNSGTATPPAGKYAGLTGFANLTGSFKQSKNSLSVAATDSFNQVELLSSRGPAYDGRIKPELVAFGQDGSSGAAALVSGTALLLQDAYLQTTGLLPRSSLVRAALVNTADDLLQPGPDFRSGFGSLNAERVLSQLMPGHFFSGTAANNSFHEFNISVPANTSSLKITLAWNDPPAAINAPKALVNDLDLEVSPVGSSITFFPLVLSHFPQADSLNKAATPGRDTLNNIEQVVVTNPAAGDYLIRVRGSKVQGAQLFDLVYQASERNKVDFTYPTRNDNLYPGVTNTIRWNNTFDPGATGSIHITRDGISWTPVATNVQLSDRYCKFQPDYPAGIARLRLTTASGTVYSDTFTITPRLQVKVIAACSDSFQLSWNKPAGVGSYRIYALTDTFLQPLQIVSDSFVTLSAQLQYVAVAPVVSGKTGLRSYAINPYVQGIGCYLNSFLADVFNDSTVELSAVLGASAAVKELSFQRLYPLTTVASFAVSADSFSATDRLLRPGIYYYRVKLVLQNGKEVFSDTLAVKIFQNKNFFVYPNPVSSSGNLAVQSGDYQLTWFELFTAAGQKVFSRRLRSESEILTLPALQSGIYFYRLVQQGRNVFHGTLLIR
ncbi:MAG TPA: S8 family peptidase, partial [Chitinophagaceae bacterium]